MAQLACNPQPLIASLSKQLKLSKLTLQRREQELLVERQLNHQLLRRIRELELELERGDQQPARRDSHNSSLPPSLDPPWQKVPRTSSLRKKTGRQPGGQLGHPGTTLRQSSASSQRSASHKSSAWMKRDCGSQARAATFMSPEPKNSHIMLMTHAVVRPRWMRSEYSRSLRAHSSETASLLTSGTNSVAIASVMFTSCVLVFVEESSPNQMGWTTPLSKPLLKIKDAVAQALVEIDPQLSEQTKNDFRQRCDKVVRKAAQLNPPPPKRKVESGAPQKRLAQPPPRSLIKWWQQRRHEVLRFPTDITVPFDHNDSERDWRMIRLRQKISGGFRTAGGALNFCRGRSYLRTTRQQGH